MAASPPTLHIHPTAPLADRVLLPGDPGRALRLAQELIDGPKMFNHNRGLWGYTGEGRDGAPLTIQATGMGGPSTAIVASELIELGARRLLRVGTCGGLDPALELGALLVAVGAVSDDGASRALGAAPGSLVAADPALLEGLLAAGERHPDGPIPSGPVVSTDLFYDAEDRQAAWRTGGARAVEMESAALFALARRRGVQAGCVLLVTDTLSGGRRRLDADAIHAGELRLGAFALAGLA